MADTVLRPETSQEIAKDQWDVSLAEFTRANRGAHAGLEVLGGDAGYKVETEDRPFNSIAADTKEHAANVWITFGRTREDHLTHGIHNATAIWLLPATETRGAALEIDAEDGTRTVLQLGK